MFPLFTISNWHPFAPAALPAFIATMGASDFRQSPPSPSLFRLVGRCALFRADYRISLVTAQSLCQARYGLRSRVVGHGLPLQLLAVPAVACWCLETIGPFQCGHFGTKNLHGRLYPLPLRLACFLAYASSSSLLSCPARLDTWPVASGYQGGIYTR